MTKKFLWLEICILCIINFLFNWFDGIIFERFLILSLFSVPIRIILEIYIIISIIKTWKKNKISINMITCFLFICNLILIYYPLDIYKVKIDLDKNKNKYMSVINNIKKQNIKNNTIIKLNDELSFLSNTGEIKIHSKEPLIVEFWTYRGLFIGNSTSLIYIENDNLDSLKNTINYIEEIQQISEYWYFIKTN